MRKTTENTKAKVFVVYMCGRVVYMAGKFDAASPLLHSVWRELVRDADTFLVSGRQA